MVIYTPIVQLNLNGTWDFRMERGTDVVYGSLKTIDYSTIVRQRCLAHPSF